MGFHVSRLGADACRLEALVRSLEGERHPVFSPRSLERAEEWIADSLAALGLRVERRPFTFRGAEYRNVVGVKEAARRGAGGSSAARVATAGPGRDAVGAGGKAAGPGGAAAPRVLVGAHFDTVPDTPGADDNGSGVAAMLEAAGILAGEELAADVEFVGFNLEEPQGAAYRVGSRRFAADARRRGVRYAGCLVLEMVGYTDARPGSQGVPPPLFWKRVPKAGNFLAATGDRRSRRLLRTFRAAASAAAPGLAVVTFRTPARGWLVPQTRLSDNASFWDRRYPALMVTDTSFLRNPHYHRATDRAETLDYEFLRQVTDATAEAVRRVAGREAGAAHRRRRRGDRRPESEGPDR